MNPVANGAALLEDDGMVQGRTVVVVIEPKSIDFGDERARTLPDAVKERALLHLLFYNAQGEETRLAAQMHDGGVAAFRDQPARVLDREPEPGAPAGVDELERVAPIDTRGGEGREAPDFGAQFGGKGV